MARIALNALALRPGGSGVQTYIRELLRQLAAGWDATLTAAVQADAVEELPNGVEPIPRRVSAGVRRAVAGLRSLGQADVVHGLDVDLPLRAGAPTVATVHDLAVFDVGHTMPWHRAAGERLLLGRALRAADALIAVSAFTAERVWARFRRESVVTHLAPSPAMVPPSEAEVARVRGHYGLPPQFVLHVGTDPRKQVAVLASACAAAGVPLVVVGPPVGRLAATALSLGYVPVSDLPALYASATVVGIASVYEGFCLPAVEAVACGAAVVATRVGALPELLDGAARLVAVGDVDALTGALRELVHDGDARAEVIARSRARVAALDWHATAAATVEVYRGLGAAVAPRTPPHA